MISARQATLEDLPRLAALAGLGIEELRPTRGGAVWAIRDGRAEPVEASLGVAIEDPKVLVVVGEIAGTVVGYGVTRVEALRDGSQLAVIDDIYVHPEGRAVSVGEGMVDLSVAWSARRGCRAIDSLALPGNRDTKNFFETFGFKARAITVHRPIDEDDLPGGGLDEGGG
jgi:ribosomal protein S18 acetylase RimI-like enzyme